jgi:hypothetical protein
MGRRKYRKRWDDWFSQEIGRAIRGKPWHQAIANYVTSCERCNAIGLYELPLPLLCHELGVDREEARRVIADLEDWQFCYYDGDREEMYVPMLAHWEYLEGPPRKHMHPRDNNIKHIQLELWKHRYSPFVWLFYQRYHNAFFLPPEMATPGDWGVPLEEVPPRRTLEEIEAHMQSPFDQEEDRAEGAGRTFEEIVEGPDEGPCEWRPRPPTDEKNGSGHENGAPKELQKPLVIQEQEQEQEQEKTCHDSEGASHSEGPAANGTGHQNGHEHPRRVRDHVPRIAPQPSGERLPDWPSTNAFLTLYREHAPLEWPDVREPLSPSLQRAITEALGRHPEKAFWQQVYNQAGKSTYLCGTARRKPEHFQPGLPWLLQRGVRDGEENALKVLKGSYNPGRRMTDIPARPLAIAPPGQGGVGAQLLSLIRGFMRDLQALCQGLEQIGMMAAAP